MERCVLLLPPAVEVQKVPRKKRQEEKKHVPAKSAKPAGEIITTKSPWNRGEVLKEGLLIKALGGTIVELHTKPTWKSHLSSYPVLYELRFPSEKDLHNGISLLWTELKDVPYDLTGGAIVVPAEAVPYFKNATPHRL